MESELFGYERAAFTGANQARKGLFEAAQRGTIFLDKIGEMSSACQVKLLRVLQESTVRPVGAHAEIPVNVRVITATNRNPPEEIALGRFRHDLFYRIAVLTIGAPPFYAIALQTFRSWSSTFFTKRQRTRNVRRCPPSPQMRSPRLACTRGLGMCGNSKILCSALLLVLGMATLLVSPKSMKPYEK